MTRKIDKNILSRGCFCRDGDKGLGKAETSPWTSAQCHIWFVGNRIHEFNRNRFQFIATFAVVTAVDSWFSFPSACAELNHIYFHPLHLQRIAMITRHVDSNNNRWFFKIIAKCNFLVISRKQKRRDNGRKISCSPLDISSSFNYVVCVWIINLQYPGFDPFEWIVFTFHR